MEQSELIKILIAVIVSMGSIIGGGILALHKGMIKRLDALDADLKEILRKVYAHEALMGELKIENKEHSRRLDHHEHRINELEKRK